MTEQSKINVLSKGEHEHPDQGVCAVEALTQLRGWPFSDRPEGLPNTIAHFLRVWNDWIPSDEMRTDLLLPLVRSIAHVDFDLSDEAEYRRHLMLIDWVVRHAWPAIMEPFNSTPAHELRQLKPIVDQRTVTAASRACDELSMLFRQFRATNRFDERLQAAGFDLAERVKGMSGLAGALSASGTVGVVSSRVHGGSVTTRALMHPELHCSTNEMLLLCADVEINEGARRQVRSTLRDFSVRVNMPAIQESATRLIQRMATVRGGQS